MEESTPLLIGPRRKSIWSRLKIKTFRKRKPSHRIILIGELPSEEFPSNSVCNQKYNVITFFPLVLFHQFRFFYNLYYLMMALSQLIPSIQIGYLYTYWGPLCFVLAVTLCREAVDDFRRYRRDREVNNQKYDRLILEGTANVNRPYVMESVSASSLMVGDIVMLHQGQRVPADMILLRTKKAMGTVYIRTDQFDGETDWKLRSPLNVTQKLSCDKYLLGLDCKVFVEKPEKDIHSFTGTCTRVDPEIYEQININNTLWSGSVIASGQATGLVIYTGSETRSVMNNAMPRSKVGRIDLQINGLSKILFAALLMLSSFMIILKGFNGPWYEFLFRFVLLLSNIIPISLRVNLDMGKVFNSWRIQRDPLIEGTVMRSTTIPEELGRIQYLLADKTGTITTNKMVFQNLHLGNALFQSSNFHEVEAFLTQHVTKEFTFVESSPLIENVGPDLPPTPRQVWEVVLALALCHNVTPFYMKENSQLTDDRQSDMTSSVVSESCGGAVPQQQLCDYQASSPDEVALVKWADMMGMALYHRDLSNISLKLRASNETKEYKILQMFPFKSENKMMGIIVQEEVTNEIIYYVKGSDDAFKDLLHAEWLPQQSKELAMQGLRTLVIAKKSLREDEYLEFEEAYEKAKSDGSEKCMALALTRLQQGLTLLGLSGVKDTLADKVPETLAMLTKAGIKIWILTGDKLETAQCVARSLHLGEKEFSASKCESRQDALSQLEVLSHQLDHQTVLIIEGKSLDVCLKFNEEQCIELLQKCSAVVVARCSPKQKAQVARLLRARKYVVAAVGDGGNDVDMIQEADIGVGIEGAEGRAASLAGDVSVRGLSSLARLLLVHGRRAYMRTAALTLFIMHRGLLISTMQAVFSCVFYFSSVSLYPGFLIIGYGTVFTTLPVFSLILDKDIPSTVALRYPQLYKQLTKGRQLSYKTFFIWAGISIYQGAVIMYGSLLLFEDQLIHIVEISYTALILTELIMVALTVETWHLLMVVAEFVGLLLYAGTLLIFTGYFDADFIKHGSFWWKVTALTIVSCLPLGIVKFTHRRWKLRQYKNMRN